MADTEELEVTNLGQAMAFVALLTNKVYEALDACAHHRAKAEALADDIAERQTIYLAASEQLTTIAFCISIAILEL